MIFSNRRNESWTSY